MVVTLDGGSRWARRSLAVALISAACNDGAVIAMPGPPWVEFTRNRDIRGSIDTSRTAPSTRGGSVTWLRFDYRTIQRVPHDSFPETGTEFIRMEWNVELRCDSEELRDLRMVVFDTTGQALVEGPGAREGWHSFAEHPVGSHVPRLACDRMERLPH